jgi:hypothetical protein
MNVRHRRELDAAIVAHCKYLEARGIALPESPEVLAACDALQIMPALQAWSFPPGGYAALLRDRRSLANAGTPRQAKVWRRSALLKPRHSERPNTPAGVPDIVIGSLHALCALRTRVRLSEMRKDLRVRAVRRASVDPSLRNAAELVALVHDDAHVRAIEPALNLLGPRLRTAVRKLQALREDLRERHEKLVAAGLGAQSSAPQDQSLARLVEARCETLIGTVNLLLTQLHGAAVADELLGHAGPADGKAWHRLRAETKSWLEAAGVPARDRAALFPDRFGAADDPDAKRTQSDRERKEVRRARKRAVSKG